jgi:hypothetical protein
MQAAPSWVELIGAPEPRLEHLAFFALFRSPSKKLLAKNLRIRPDVIRQVLLDDTNRS